MQGIMVDEIFEWRLRRQVMPKFIQHMLLIKARLLMHTTHPLNKSKPHLHCGLLDLLANKRRYLLKTQLCP
jgi:hypothetical protein